VKREMIRVALTVVLCLAAVCAARAQSCSNSDFKGVYSALVTGSFITAPAAGVPTGATARIGRVQVDGNGVSSIAATLSLLGFIFQENYGGNYTINADCSADVILNVLFPGSPNPVPFHFLGSLSDSGNSMDLILSNPQGSDLRITLKRQPQATCSTSDLNGPYSLSIAGRNFMVPINPNGLFARVGQVKFDGVGGFTASVHTSYNGIVLLENFSGSYTMASNCIFKTSFNLYGFASGWTGVTWGGTAGAYLLADAPAGGVVTGSLVRVH
jgi:hypothetical protein